jgi:mRNA interferase RelE/StbE
LSFKVAFKKSVARDLKKIEKKQIDAILRRIEKELPQKAQDFTLLTGQFSGLRKFRIGDYRVIYSIVGDTALILRISHRREAYK